MYCKATNRKYFLHLKSVHPKSLIESIPQGQAPQLKVKEIIENRRNRNLCDVIKINRT